MRHMENASLWDSRDGTGSLVFMSWEAEHHGGKYIMGCFIKINANAAVIVVIPGRENLIALCALLILILQIMLLIIDVMIISS